MAFEWVPYLNGKYLTYRAYLTIIACLLATSVLAFLWLIVYLMKCYKTISKKCFA